MTVAIIGCAVSALVIAGTILRHRSRHPDEQGLDNDEYLERMARAALHRGEHEG